MLPYLIKLLVALTFDSTSWKSPTNNQSAAYTLFKY